MGEEKSDCVSITIANQAGDFGTPDPDKVFKRYYRNPYAQKTSGTGLGLYLTQSICTILGGQIRYEPRENLICFLVELPIQLTAPLRANS